MIVTSDGQCVSSSPPTTSAITNVWARPLHTGGWAAVFINAGPITADITCDSVCFKDMGVPANTTLTVLDLCTLNFPFLFNKALLTYLSGLSAPCRSDFVYRVTPTGMINVLVDLGLGTGGKSSVNTAKGFYAHSVAGDGGSVMVTFHA